MLILFIMATKSLILISSENCSCENQFLLQTFYINLPLERSVPTNFPTKDVFFEFTSLIRAEHI